MKIELTPEKERRLRETIADTERMLKKERAYSPDLQNKVRIDELEIHIERLNKFLKQGFVESNF